MRRFSLLLSTCLGVLVLAGVGSAQEVLDPSSSDQIASSHPWDDCGLFAVDSLGEPICGDAAAEEPALATASAAETASIGAAAEPAATNAGLEPQCRIPVEVVMWTASDSMRLARALAADQSPCAEYWITLPASLPAPGDCTGMRPGGEAIRRLGANSGANFHVLAEVRLAPPCGWVTWVANNSHRFASVEETWYQAGVLVRRRMVTAGYDQAKGDSWLVNEMNADTRRNVGAYSRANMLALLRGLYEGPSPGTSDDLPGAVEIGIHYSHQNLPLADVRTYKEELKAWLEDSQFWTEMSPATRWLLREVYADSRSWGVPGSSRNDRRKHLSDYQFHMLELARAGPSSVDAARSFLERTYLPLANSGWMSPGGDLQLPPTPPFSGGHGNTLIGVDLMKHFVSEQVFSIRHYAGSHPQGAPAGRLGFSWQPINRAELGLTAVQFVAGQVAIAARLASSIHYAYRQGGASPAGACAPPDTEENWCAGERAGATFTPAWSSFSTW